MDQYLTSIREQHDKTVGLLREMTDRATAESRDLTDQETETFNDYSGRIERLGKRIEELVDVERSVDASAAALSLVSDKGQQQLRRAETPDITEVFKTPGEYVSTFLARTWAETPDGRRTAHERMARSIQNQTVADNLGVIPQPIVGPVINLRDTRRAVWNSLTGRNITSGPTFFRPRVTQHVSVQKQASEKTELSSRKMQIERLPINVGSFGGVIDISLQDQMWSNPSIVDILIADLRSEYVLQVEAAAATELARAATVSKITALASLAPDVVTKGIFDAAVQTFNATGELPTHVAMSADVWAAIGAMVDTTKRPLFPSVAPMNAEGRTEADSFSSGRLWGLVPVVSPSLPAKSLIVYTGALLEAWEQIIGVLTVQEPRLLGTELAYAGFAAVKALDDGAAVKIPLP